MKWFTVLLRCHGDDEDSLYRDQHATVKEAIAAAKRWVRGDHGNRPIYVQYVLESVHRPRLVVNNCGFGGIDEPLTREGTNG